MDLTVDTIDVAGLKINPLTKLQFLELVAQRLRDRRKTFVVTAYSEFLYNALRDSKVMQLLNSSDMTIADGVGVVWADKFLRIPFRTEGFYTRVLEGLVQIVFSGAAILIEPRYVYDRIPEKIVGADLIWDLAELAVKEDKSVFLFGGGFDDRVVKGVKLELEKRFPTIRIVGVSNAPHDDPRVLEHIIHSDADMLFVALGRGQQEQWIQKNLPQLPATFAIGLGGTFDYIMGVQRKPPQWVREWGLEWLYRWITQPHRFWRVFEGFFGLMQAVLRHKVYETMPHRLNASAVVLNSTNQILIVRRAASNPGVHHTQPEDGQQLWLLPQGGIENGEDLVYGIKRELLEELHLSLLEFIKVANYHYRYNWPHAHRPLVPPRFKFRGQEQYTVFFRYTGNDAELQPDGHEIDGYKWVTREELAEHLTPERIHHLIKVLAELDETSQ